MVYAIPILLAIFSVAFITAGVLVLIRPPFAFLAFIVDFHDPAVVYIVGCALVVVGVVGPGALVWCVACLKSPGRRTFYFDSLLDHMIDGDAIDEHYTVDGPDAAVNGTIVFLAGNKGHFVFPRNVHQLSRTLEWRVWRVWLSGLFQAQRCREAPFEFTRRS